MAKKLYVGNLPWSATDEVLKETFSAAGKVDTATVIMDKMSGRSKGFGFVEMSSEDEAQKAIEMFNGKELDGRKLTVNEARPMEPRAPRGEPRGGNWKSYRKNTPHGVFLFKKVLFGHPRAIAFGKQNKFFPTKNFSSPSASCGLLKNYYNNPTKPTRLRDVPEKQSP